MKPLYPGRIFWHVAPGERGGGKPRPMIVATRLTEILRGSPVLAVVCSTRCPEPLKPGEVPIPFDPEGVVSTGLRRKTVAICDWIVTLQADEIGPDRGGIVNPGLLKEICTTAGIPSPNER